MGPKCLYLGPEVPAEDFIWQDPLPALKHQRIDENNTNTIKQQILKSDLKICELVTTAWASASTFRNSDHRGGANGARIRMAPQKNWEVNQPQQLVKVLNTLETIQTEFNTNTSKGKHVSLADIIVLAGNTAVEAAVKAAGYEILVPFSLGRTDACESQTDADSFAVLEPQAT